MIHTCVQCEHKFSRPYRGGGQPKYCSNRCYKKANRQHWRTRALAAEAKLKEAGIV